MDVYPGEPLQDCPTLTTPEHRRLAHTSSVECGPVGLLSALSLVPVVKFLAGLQQRLLCPLLVRIMGPPFERTATKLSIIFTTTLRHELQQGLRVLGQGTEEWNGTAAGCIWSGTLLACK